MGLQSSLAFAFFASSFWKCLPLVTLLCFVIVSSFIVLVQCLWVVRAKRSQVDTWISDPAFPSLTNVTISSIIWKVEATTVASTPCDHCVKSVNMHMYAWVLIHFQADKKIRHVFEGLNYSILKNLGSEISFILQFQFSVFLLLPSFFYRNCLASKIILCCFCTKSKSHPPLQESIFGACLIGRLPGGTCWKYRVLLVDVYKAFENSF